MVGRLAAQSVANSGKSMVGSMVDWKVEMKAIVRAQMMVVVTAPLLAAMKAVLSAGLLELMWVAL